jgi:hypothetical protein
MNEYPNLQEWLDDLAALWRAETRPQVALEDSSAICDMCHYEPVTRYRGAYGYCQECLYELDCDNDD